MERIQENIGIVPEIDILIEVGKFLADEGWNITFISVPKGNGINQEKDRQKLWEEFERNGIYLKSQMFRDDGPDIVAKKEDGTILKIECKGIGDVKPSTWRNNVDRLVASAVSYYESPKSHIGLAIPIGPYMDLISKRVPQALREAINMWSVSYTHLTLPTN